MAEISRALTLKSGSALAYLLRWLLRRDQGADLTDLNQAMKSNPFFPKALAHCAGAHLQASLKTTALADLDHALALRPWFSLALFYRAILRFHAGQFDWVEALFRRALTFSPAQHPIAALWLAAAIGRQGRGHYPQTLFFVVG